METGMKKPEIAYDDLPYNLKEEAGFPARYFNLSVQQKNFIDSMIGISPTIDTSKIISKIRNIERSIEDIDYDLAAIEEEVS
jgi:hypothetical protein